MERLRGIDKEIAKLVDFINKTTSECRIEFLCLQILFPDMDSFKTKRCTGEMDIEYETEELIYESNRYRPQD